MTTHYSILTPPQLEIIETLRTLPSLGFVLYGGTAIALQIGHRRSNDFDFFSRNDIDKKILCNAAPVICDSITIQDEINTWTIQVYMDGCRTRPVKLSFFGGLDFGRVGTPVKTERGELLMASLDDLFGHKLKTLLQRTELRDYQDIAALIRAGYGLDRGLAAASALFKGFPAAEAMRALTYFKGGDVHLLSQEDKGEIIEQVRLTREFSPLPLLANTLV